MVIYNSIYSTFRRYRQESSRPHRCQTIPQNAKTLHEKLHCTGHFPSGLGLESSGNKNLDNSSVQYIPVYKRLMETARGILDQINLEFDWLK